MPLRLKSAVALAIVSTCLAHAAAAQPREERSSAHSCLESAAWYTMTQSGPRASSAREVLTEMSRREIVLLGEQHDDPAHHQWQLQTLAALHVMRPDMIIGFESFPRRAQPILDRWIAGELTARQFLELTEWNKAWNYPPELYLPLFHFARLNRIPIIALNVDRALTEAVRQKGWDAVPDLLKEGVSRPAPASDTYLDMLFEVYKQHARDPKGKPAPASRGDRAFRHFVEAQLVWDRAMAEALANRLARNDSSRPLVVGIAGSGHLRGGHGVPRQLRDLGVERVGTLLPVNARRDCAEAKMGLADAIFALADPPREEAPRPRLGVRLEESAGEVRLADVVAGSLAEKTGLERGDRIVTIAGAPVTRMAAVIAAVRAQPAGTWLPVEVMRNREKREFVIKFPRE